MARFRSCSDFVPMIIADALVLGIGGVGSAALAELARRGVSAVGIDQYAPPHERGSSHGQTRIIRQAYFEHPDYVPLLLRAYELWHALEERSGRRLLLPLGLAQVGPAAGAVVRGVQASAALHELPIETLSAEEATRRFPALRVPAGMMAVYEARAGALRVERCVQAHLDEARAAGALVRNHEAIVDWHATPDAVEVRTTVETYRAARMIVAAGAWAGRLLGDLGLPLVVRRKSQFWFEPAGDTLRADSRCPAFLFELPEGVFYGVPALDEQGVKLAEHTGGAVVTDPAQVDRTLDPSDEARLRRFAANCLHGLGAERTAHAVCLYTLTPDEHFVVDRHPVYPHVVYAAGLSGHGFKFATVLGEALAELAVDGRARLPIGFLSAAPDRWKNRAGGHGA